MLPVFTESGTWMRLIAGDAFGLTSNVRTCSPLFYLHVVRDENARIGLPAGHTERAIYVANGTVEVSGRTYLPGQIIVFAHPRPSHCLNDPYHLAGLADLRLTRNPIAYISEYKLISLYKLSSLYYRI